MLFMLATIPLRQNVNVLAIVDVLIKLEESAVIDIVYDIVSCGRLEPSTVYVFDGSISNILLKLFT